MASRRIYYSPRKRVELTAYQKRKLPFSLRKLDKLIGQAREVHLELNGIKKYLQIGDFAEARRRMELVQRMSEFSDIDAWLVEMQQED